MKTDSDKDFIDSVRQIIDRLKGKNPKARTKFHSIPGLHPYIHGKIVEQALINNQAWKAKTGTTYDGAGYIYNALCRATHSNISSVIQRLDAVDGITVPNTLTPNTERCLTLAYTIIEDIYNKLKPLFTKT